MTKRPRQYLFALLFSVLIIGVRAKDALATNDVSSSPLSSTLTVTNLNGSGPGSLRQAILDTPEGGTIAFAVTGAIPVGPVLSITKDLIIEGPVANGISLEADSGSILKVESGVHVVIKSLNLVCNSCGEHGIVNLGDLMVIDTSISATGSSLGGINEYIGGSKYGERLVVINSTITGWYDGMDLFGNVQLIHVTVANSNDDGIAVHGGSRVTAKNSILASSGDHDCELKAGARLYVAGDNLTQDGSCTGFTLTHTVPQLGGLSDNGGPTKTIPLQLTPAVSPAIDAVTDCSDLDGNPVTTDQRGYARPYDGDANGTARCDLGAFEAGASPAVNVIEELFGAHYGSATVDLFGQTYTVAWFSLADPPTADDFVYLPFYGTPAQFTRDAFIANSELAQSVLETFAFNQTMLHTHDLSEFVTEFEQREVFYRPNEWWRELILPPLFSKRQADRLRLAQLNLVIGEELLWGVATHGYSAAGGLWEITKTLYEQDRLEHLNLVEIEALLLYMARYNENLPAVESLLFQAEQPDLSRIIALGDLALFLSDLADLRNAAQGVRAAVALPRSAGKAAVVNSAIDNLRDVRVAQDISFWRHEISEAVASRINDSFDFWDEMETWAMVDDAHTQALGAISRDLRDYAYTVESLTDGSLPENLYNLRLLQESHYEMFYLYAYMFNPILAEQYAAMAVHWRRVQEHADDDYLAWWSRLREEDVEQIQQLAEGIDEVYIQPYQGYFGDYVEDVLLYQSMYSGAYSAIVLEDTDDLLIVSLPQGAHGRLGTTTPVELSFRNEYSVPVSVVTINSAAVTSASCSLSINGGVLGDLPPHEQGIFTAQLTVDTYWFTCDSGLTSDRVEVPVLLQWFTGTEYHERAVIIPVQIDPAAALLSPGASRYAVEPGEMINIDLRWTPFVSTDPAIGAFLLRPDGQRISVAIAFADENTAAFSFESPAGPYGSYGLEVILTDTSGGSPRFQMLPTAYFVNLFQVLPSPPEELASLAPEGVALICSESDGEIAMSVSRAMAIPFTPVNIFYFEQYSVQDLIAVASSRDTVLIDVNNGNPLVSGLLTTGSAAGTTLAEGDAYITLVESAFGPNDALIIGGYTPGDAHSAALSFIDQWVTGAELSGTVSLQGRTPPPNSSWSEVLTLVAVPDELPDSSSTFSVMSDEYGVFPLNLAPGNYRFWLKGEHSLAVQVYAPMVYGHNDLDFGLLPEGDANDDNLVNISDFSILASSFAKSSGDSGFDARADFNDDGMVTIADFSLLATNFGQSGAAP